MGVRVEHPPEVDWKRGWTGRRQVARLVTQVMNQWTESTVALGSDPQEWSAAWRWTPRSRSSASWRSGSSRGSWTEPTRRRRRCPPPPSSPRSSGSIRPPPTRGSTCWWTRGSSTRNGASACSWRPVPGSSCWAPAARPSPGSTSTRCSPRRPGWRSPRRTCPR
ncbi:hypothetical protein ACFFX0_18035 [Citricoccus parietis]|uniref:Uncharacterized protein n=1 Tax=Citricoccus parietis TaxID=592307 RepID=A0ABV5G237_9MICC